MCKLVNENLFEFKKGLDPIDSLGLGHRTQIEEWLKSMDIHNYVINDDYTIDVNTSVNISWYNIKKFPDFIQFGTISHNFYCESNHLVSLRGCPMIVKGTFSCSFNNLTSLKYAPLQVYESFECMRNNIFFTKSDVSKVCNVKGRIYT